MILDLHFAKMNLAPEVKKNVWNVMSVTLELPITETIHSCALQKQFTTVHTNYSQRSLTVHKLFTTVHYTNYSQLYNYTNYLQ